MHECTHSLSSMNKNCCHQKKKKKIKDCKKSLLCIYPMHKKKGKQKQKKKQTNKHIYNAHVYGHMWLKPILRKHQQTCRKTEIHNRERGSYLSNEHSVSQWSSDKSSWECRVPDKHCIRQAGIEHGRVY